MGYKVKKKTKGRIVIKGIEFNFGKEVNVSKEVFEYIKSTFPTTFEVFEDVKKVEKKEEKSTIRKGRRQKDK